MHVHVRIDHPEPHTLSPKLHEAEGQLGSCFVAEKKAPSAYTMQDVDRDLRMTPRLVSQIEATKLQNTKLVTIVSTTPYLAATRDSSRGTNSNREPLETRQCATQT